MYYQDVRNHEHKKYECSSTHNKSAYSNGVVAQKPIVAQFVEPGSSVYEAVSCKPLFIEPNAGPKSEPNYPSMPDAPTR
jgi:hypothetical protein